MVRNDVISIPTPAPPFQHKPELDPIAQKFSWAATICELVSSIFRKLFAGSTSGLASFHITASEAADEVTNKSPESPTKLSTDISSQPRPQEKRPPVIEGDVTEDRGILEVQEEIDVYSGVLAEENEAFLQESALLRGRTLTTVTEEPSSQIDLDENTNIESPEVVQKEISITELDLTDNSAEVNSIEITVSKDQDPSTVVEPDSPTIKLPTSLTIETEEGSNPTIFVKDNISETSSPLAVDLNDDKTSAENPPSPTVLYRPSLSPVVRSKVNATKSQCRGAKALALFDQLKSSASGSLIRASSSFNLLLSRLTSNSKPIKVVVPKKAKVLALEKPRIRVSSVRQLRDQTSANWSQLTGQVTALELALGLDPVLRFAPKMIPLIKDKYTLAHQLKAETAEGHFKATIAKETIEGLQNRLATIIGVLEERSPSLVGSISLETFRKFLVSE